MPTLSMFFGIVIYMNKEDNEPHHVPHLHARYQGNDASFDFDGEFWQGLFSVVKGNMWKHGYYSIKMNSLRTGIS